MAKWIEGSPPPFDWRTKMQAERKLNMNAPLIIHGESKSLHDELTELIGLTSQISHKLFEMTNGPMECKRRQNGQFWVREFSDAGWVVAEWEYDAWLFSGRSDRIGNDGVEEINENRITAPTWNGSQ